MENKQKLYTSPEVEVLEINARQVICESGQNAGNDGYDSKDYEW